MGILVGYSMDHDSRSGPLLDPFKIRITSIYQSTIKLAVYIKINAIMGFDPIANIP